MRVKMNRDDCSEHLAYCERCLVQFLKFPPGYERRCFEEFEDDGKDELTMELHTGGKTVVLHLNEAQRLQLAGESWA